MQDRIGPEDLTLSEAATRDMQSEDTLDGPPAIPLSGEQRDDQRTLGADGAGSSASRRTQDEPRLYPATIGDYRIIRQLGQGGMGVVYEAEQSQPRRRVALKVIRAAWASPDLLRRFEQESQALGRLHHPGIAQIYEAGSADTGFGVQPYFAMELIQGTPLVEYAEQHKLDTRQRLALMVLVCEAVQHAHQRGIIHRDLKPGNILVDETGQPKVLDFGLARATDSDNQATRQTDVGQLLGTLAYMSPEQVLADPLAVDTRSDVYALGVILYELLAGKMPYALSNQLIEAVRTIQQTDAAPLSVVSRVYRGDIETIVAKALEKDKARRYGSASELAADIQHYLRHEPITAKPASSTYQLKKFARRNRAFVAGVAAVFVVLVMGVVASSWEAVKARRAEKNALQQTDIAKAVNDFLQDDLLAQASAFNQSKPDPDLKVRTALDRAAQNIQGKFGGQPAVEAEIRSTIGSTYYGLGLYPEALVQQVRAVDLKRASYGPESVTTMKTELDLAKTEEQAGKYADADQLGSELLKKTHRMLGSNNILTLSAMNQLTSVYDEEGKFAEGAALGTQAVTISRRVLGPDAPKTLASEFFLAIMLYEEGKYAEADSLGRRTIAARSRVLGPEHPDTLSSMNNLAVDLDAEGKVKEAETLSRKTWEVRSRVLGPEHPDTIDSMVNLAADLKEERQYDEAEALDRRALEVQKRVLGPEHPLTLRSMDNLAIDYRVAGKFAEAEAINANVLAIRRRTLGNDSPDTLGSMAQLSAVYRAQGNNSLAEVFDRQTYEARRRVLGKDSADTLGSLSSLATDLARQQKLPQAQDVYRKALGDSPDNPTLLSGLAYFDASSANVNLCHPQEALSLARRAVKAAPDNEEYLGTLGVAELRSGLWDDAVASLTKASATGDAPDATELFYLAMAYQGRHSIPEAKATFLRGVEAARKYPFLQPQLRELWTEAAASVSMPGPPKALPKTGLQRSDPSD